MVSTATFGPLTSVAVSLLRNTTSRNNQMRSSHEGQLSHLTSDTHTSGLCQIFECRCTIFQALTHAPHSMSRSKTP